MIEYRKKIKNRLMVLIISLFVAIAAVIVGILLTGNAETPESTYLDGMVKGFPIGLFTGFCIIMIVLIIVSIRALVNEAALKKMHIYENDERKMMIRRSALGQSFFFTVGILIVGETVASFYNSVVAITLMCVLSAHVLVAALLKLYYTLKY